MRVALRLARGLARGAPARRPRSGAAAHSGRLRLRHERPRRHHRGGRRWGGTLAVEEINAKGGRGGRKLEAYFADNKATPGEAVSAVRKLADVDKVDVIIGQTHSGACLGAMPVVKEIGVPMVIEACSHPQIRALSAEGRQRVDVPGGPRRRDHGPHLCPLHGAQGVKTRPSSP